MLTEERDASLSSVKELNEKQEEIVNGAEQKMSELRELMQRYCVWLFVCYDSFLPRSIHAVLENSKNTVTIFPCSYNYRLNCSVSRIQFLFWCMDQRQKLEINQSYLCNIYRLIV